jgi:Arc/MetJ-type ribon-helix-helix transcriptional regulator
VIRLKVSHTFSIELDDLAKIQEKIKNGDFANISEFVQKAVKNELRR